MVSKILGICAIITTLLPLYLMTQITVSSGWYWQGFNIVALTLAAVGVFMARELPDTKPPVLPAFAVVLSLISFSAIGMYFLYV